MYTRGYGYIVVQREKKTHTRWPVQQLRVSESRKKYAAETIRKQSESLKRSSKNIDEYLPLIEPVRLG